VLAFYTRKRLRPLQLSIILRI